MKSEYVLGDITPLNAKQLHLLIGFYYGLFEFFFTYGPSIYLLAELNCPSELTGEKESTENPARPDQDTADKSAILERNLKALGLTLEEAIEAGIEPETLCEVELETHDGTDEADQNSFPTAVNTTTDKSDINTNTDELTPPAKENRNEFFLSELSTLSGHVAIIDRFYEAAKRLYPVDDFVPQYRWFASAYKESVVEGRPMRISRNQTIEGLRKAMRRVISDLIGMEYRTGMDNTNANLLLCSYYLFDIAHKTAYYADKLRKGTPPLDWQREARFRLELLKKFPQALNFKKPLEEAFYNYILVLQKRPVSIACVLKGAFEILEELVSYHGTARPLIRKENKKENEPDFWIF